VRLSALKTRQTLVGELLQPLGRDIAVDVEAVGRRTAYYPYVGSVPAEEDAYGGMLQSVVAAHCIDYSF
jgi:hypothetical protein